VDNLCEIGILYVSISLG